jgi:peptidoglycan/LPS O-acetylase OafA/YrhL
MGFAAKTLDHAAFLARSRFEPLDGLRCLSVLPVILFHSAPSAPSGFVARGPLGVDMFFALSGFLITTLLLRERSRRGSISLGAFWVRRTRRIVPLYVAVLALYAVYAFFMPAGSPTREHFFRSLPYYATYTTNWLVDFNVTYPVLFAFSWSLAVEEQFYVVWPPLLALFGGPSVPLVLMGIAIALHACPVPIGLGAMIAIVLHDRRGFALLGTLLQKPVVTFVLGILACCTFFLDVPLLLAHLTFALVVAAAAVSPAGSRAFAWLNLAPLRYVGEVSYGMYLLHVTAIGVVRKAGVHDTWPVFALGTLLTLLLAVAVRKPEVALQSPKPRTIKAAA